MRWSGLWLQSSVPGPSARSHWTSCRSCFFPLLLDHFSLSAFSPLALTSKPSLPLAISLSLPRLASFFQAQFLGTPFTRNSPLSTITQLSWRPLCSLRGWCRRYWSSVLVCRSWRPHRDTRCSLMPWQGFRSVTCTSFTRSLSLIKIRPLTNRTSCIWDSYTPRSHVLIAWRPHRP